MSGRTVAEARDRRTEALAELDTARPLGRLGAVATVADLAGFWLENVAAPSVRPGTLHAYEKDTGQHRVGLRGCDAKEFRTRRHEGR